MFSFCIFGDEQSTATHGVWDYHSYIVPGLVFPVDFPKNNKELFLYLLKERVILCKFAVNSKNFPLYGTCTND